MSTQNQIYKGSLDSFINHDFYNAYKVLFDHLRSYQEDEIDLLYLAGYALATGCEDLAQFYISEVGNDGFLNFIQDPKQSALLKTMIFHDEINHKWDNYRRPRNGNELNRFGVTAPLCSGDVLEVGCANGDLSTAIAMHANRLFGIDIDPVAIELARYKICLFGLDNGYFQLADAADLDFEDNSFDTVVLAEVLEHVQNPRSVVTEAIRVCKPDGKIIVSVPKGYAIPDSEHVRIFTSESLGQLVASCQNSCHLKWINEVPSSWILGYFKNRKQRVTENRRKLSNLIDSFVPPHRLSPFDKSEKVSVIIPTYNRGKSLIRSLESVFSQTYPNKEVIVVDDGSTDETADLMKNYKDRIIYLRQENGGKSAALNRALPKANGKYVWIFDDDDVALPKKLELQIRKFQEHPDIGLIHTSAVIMEEQQGKTVYQGMWHARKIDERFLLREKLKGNYFFSPTVIAKKVAFQKAGQFDERLTRAQDYDMWLRISRYFKIEALPIPTIHYLFYPYAKDSKLAKQTQKGNQLILRKARAIPLDQVFPKEGYTDDRAYEAESLLERAVYMAKQDLVYEFLADLERVKGILNKGTTPLNFTSKGLQIITNLNKVVDQKEAPFTADILNDILKIMEKTNQ